MTPQNPAQAPVSSAGRERVEPDGPLSGAVKREGARPRVVFDWKAAGWDRDRDVALSEHPELVRDVYFVLATESRRVKIGVAKDLRNRVHHLQTGCPEPLELLGSIRTDAPWEIEAELHEAWEHIRVRGEWFRATHALLRYIAKNRDQRFETAVP